VEVLKTEAQIRKLGEIEGFEYRKFPNFEYVTFRDERLEVGFSTYGKEVIPIDKYVVRANVTGIPKSHIDKLKGILDFNYYDHGDYACVEIICRDRHLVLYGE